MTDEQFKAAAAAGLRDNYTDEQVRTMNDAEFRQTIIDILKTVWPDDDYSDFLVDMKDEKPAQEAPQHNPPV